VAGKKMNTIYDRNTLFPRMFSEKAGPSRILPDVDAALARNTLLWLPTLAFSISWQVTQMYTRYFLWNFAGRANEMDGQTRQGGIDGAG
jgi:hypothetical protein